MSEEKKKWKYIRVEFDDGSTAIIHREDIEKMELAQETLKAIARARELSKQIGTMEIFGWER